MSAYKLRGINCSRMAQIYYLHCSDDVLYTRLYTPTPQGAGMEPTSAVTPTCKASVARKLIGPVSTAAGTA